MMYMNDMMEGCMNMMGSMMGMASIVLGLLLLLVLGLALVGGLGYVAVRRLRT